MMWRFLAFGCLCLITGFMLGETTMLHSIESKVKALKKCCCDVCKCENCKCDNGCCQK